MFHIKGHICGVGALFVCIHHAQKIKLNVQVGAVLSCRLQASEGRYFFTYKLLKLAHFRTFSCIVFVGQLHHINIYY